MGKRILNFLRQRMQLKVDSIDMFTKGIHIQLVIL